MVGSKKTFVIDATVLLHDPTALTHFVGQDVVIPVPVLEEIDKLKKFRDEVKTIISR